MTKFEIVADVSSILSFLGTLVVWWQVRSIKRSFLQRARLPELSKELSRISKALLEVLRDPSRTFGKEVARLIAVLFSLTTKTERIERDLVTGLLIKCGVRHPRWALWKTIDPLPLTRVRAWEIYEESEGLIESLTQSQKDLEWK